MFSPFLKTPDVNLTGAEELLDRAKKRILGIAECTAGRPAAITPKLTERMAV